MTDLKAVDEQPKLIHPDIISEISGVKTEDMYDRMIGPTPIGEEEKPLAYAQHVAKARKNAGLDTTNQAQGVNKKQDEVIVIDNDVDDVYGNLVRGVVVKEDPVDCFSVSRESNFPWQKLINPGKNDQVAKEGEH